MPAIRTPKDLVALLKSRRLELGETQTESAARIRKTQSWVSDLERSTTPNIYIGRLLEVLPPAGFDLDAAPREPTRFREPGTDHEQAGQHLRRAP